MTGNGVKSRTNGNFHKFDTTNHTEPWIQSAIFDPKTMLVMPVTGNPEVNLTNSGDVTRKMRPRPLTYYFGDAHRLVSFSASRTGQVTTPI